MADNTMKLNPVRLSSLPVIEDTKDFWVFGSKDENGTFTSGRFLIKPGEKSFGKYVGANILGEGKFTLSSEERMFSASFSSDITLKEDNATSDQEIYGTVYILLKNTDSADHKVTFGNADNFTFLPQGNEIKVAADAIVEIAVKAYGKQRVVTHITSK